MSGNWHLEWGLEKLLGEWIFEREISGKGMMKGGARFEAVAEGRALYREAGELLLEDGSQLRGEQQYFYEPITGGFAIYFCESSGLFQEVRFGTVEGGAWKAAAKYVCKADVYLSSYVFGRDGGFEIRHAVEGPRKGYEIRTVYRRDGRAHR